MATGDQMSGAEGSDRSNALSREHLIDLCTRGVVSQASWSDRDSASAQRQLGECRALLAAGCDFTVDRDGERILWVWVYSQGFNYFEYGPHDGQLDSERYYVPTNQRLEAVNGGDWYC